jgi:hypothetical protein
MPIVTSDPSLASYHDPRYVEHQEDLRFIHDMYVGREAWLSPHGYLTRGDRYKHYLPQELKEDSKVYHSRLLRSQFERRFGNAIDAFTGLLSRFMITGDLPPSVLTMINTNCDRMGGSIRRLLVDADRKALRDGICYILVDYPHVPPEELEFMTYAQQLEGTLRPYLTLYDRRQVVNLILSTVSGDVEIFVVKEAVSTRSSRFGYSETIQYKVLYPGGGETYLCKEAENGDAVLVPDKTWQTSENLLPLVPYTISIAGGDTFAPRLPFLDLAMLNLKHYQIVSEKDEIRRRCNFPILNVNRKDSPLPTSVTTARKDPKTKEVIPPEIVVGSNTVILNAEVNWVEPTGSALQITIDDIRNLEDAMSQKTLDFLTLGDVARTATEIVHTAAPLSASLAGMIIAKESATHKILHYWQTFIEGDDYEADIVVDEGSIRSTINAANIDRLTAMRAAGDLSRETYLELTKEARVLPPSFDISGELIRLNTEYSMIAKAASRAKK